MLVVTPNLCLDITVRVPRLLPGAILRSTATQTSAGGKGVNVSRAAHTLGAAPVLAGFLPDDDGGRFTDLLSREGSAALIAVDVPGVVRVATIVLADDGQVTVINGRGPDIDGPSWDALAGEVDTALAGGATGVPQDVLICSGSLPPGVPVEAYARLTALAHRHGVPTIVDASPPVLQAALLERPDLVSPNLSEAEGLLLGRTDEQVHEEGDDIPDRAVAASRALHAAGAVRAVVTAGAAGAALTTASGSWWLAAAAVSVVNPIGAGDCFAAGAAIALVRGDSDTDIVRRGMAAASASCETPTAGVLDPARAAELFDRIAARRIADPVPAERS